MLEAEIEDGDFSEITQAIQNALGPQKIIQTQLIKPNDSPTELTEFLEEVSDADESLVSAAGNGSNKARSSSRRSFPTPEVAEVDWNVSPTIEEFISAHPPKTTADKFLVTLAWFKEAAGKDAVLTNEVYTVFRKVKWSTAIKDFSQPLRDLKGQQFISGGAKQGFVINHLGAARVEEMKG